MPTIRKGSTIDIPVLLDIWRRSVKLSHKFLTPDDITSLEPEARQGLGVMELWVAEVEGIPAGFMAMNANMIEALFIDPDHIGRKLGSSLIDHAKKVRGNDTELRVDVNEDNLNALGFYLAQGFKQTGRSPIDSAGRPWPLLHLSLSLR